MINRMTLRRKHERNISRRFLVFPISNKECLVDEYFRIQEL